jgi:hypothetical protein
MLVVDRHVAAGTVREDFQRLVGEGVAGVGRLKTMKEITNRIREGIVPGDPVGSDWRMRLAVSGLRRFRFAFFCGNVSKHEDRALFRGIHGSFVPSFSRSQKEIILSAYQFV